MSPSVLLLVFVCSEICLMYKFFPKVPFFLNQFVCLARYLQYPKTVKILSVFFLLPFVLDRRVAWQCRQNVHLHYHSERI